MLAAIAFNARDQIATPRRGLKNLGRNALCIEHRFDVLGRLDFIARWIARVDFHQLRKKSDRLGTHSIVHESCVGMLLRARLKTDNNCTDAECQNHCKSSHFSHAKLLAQTCKRYAISNLTRHFSVAPFDVNRMCGLLPSAE